MAFEFLGDTALFNILTYDDFPQPFSPYTIVRLSPNSKGLVGDKAPTPWTSEILFNIIGQLLVFENSTAEGNVVEGANLLFSPRYSTFAKAKALTVSFSISSFPCQI